MFIAGKDTSYSLYHDVKSLLETYCAKEVITVTVFKVF